MGIGRRTILLIDCHAVLTNTFINEFTKLNYSILLCDNSFKNIGGLGRLHSEESIKNFDTTANLVSLKEIKVNPPDCICVTGLQAKNSVLKVLLRELRKSPKIIYFEGNNYQENAYDGFENVIAADYLTWKKLQETNRNVLLYFPPLNTQIFKWNGYSDSLIIRSYINDYQKRFVNDYYFVQLLKPLLIQEGFTYEHHEYIAFTEIPYKYRNSIATLQIKSREGYGFSILESMAIGRPCIMYRPFSIDKSYRWWCNEETSLNFSSIPELKNKLIKYRDNVEYRKNLQLNASEIVSKILLSQIQAENLETYLNTVFSNSNHFKADYSFIPKYENYKFSLPEKESYKELEVITGALKIINRRKRKIFIGEAIIHAYSRFLKKLFKGNIFLNAKNLPKIFRSCYICQKQYVFARKNRDLLLKSPEKLFKYNHSSSL